MQIHLRKQYVLPALLFVVILFFLSKSGNSLIGRSAGDPELVARLRGELLRPPAASRPYRLQQPELADPSVGQARLVLEALGNKTVGTFVECGALDGETRSNTLYMERYLGWRGLLIEADPTNFQLLLEKNRRAWAVQACLSGNTVSEVRFKHDFNMGRIDDGRTDHLTTEGPAQYEYSNVLCLPLEAMLKALLWPTVDYFSLDVEGHEYTVLAALPFERLDIRTLSVEFRHVPEGKEAIRQLMESKGYQVYSEVTHPNDLANDFIFVRKT